MMADVMANVFANILGVPETGVWTDPNVWMAGAVIMVIVAFIMIYYKVFLGERTP